MNDTNRIKQVPGGVLELIKILLVSLLMVHLTCMCMAMAAEMETPIDIQISLFLKILTFDRNFKQRFGDEVVIGILYQEKYRTSLNVKKQIEDYLEKPGENQIEDIPLRWVAVNSGGFPAIQAAIAREKIDIIYIAPLRAIAIEKLVSMFRSRGITSLTGVPEYCKSGITIGIGSRGGNPLIIINLAGAQSEGADFSSRLLKLAKIVK